LIRRSDLRFQVALVAGYTPAAFHFPASGVPHPCVAFLPVGRKTLRSRKPTPYPDVPVALGDHLRKRRYELGLLEREVAAQLEVDVAAVHNWETGLTSPAIRYIPRVIRFLGYDPYPAPESLPARLLAARRRQGISRREFAGRLGLDEEMLARWERGTRRPQGKYLTLVERFLRGRFLRDR
jgi:transcriptional regulator with XRE-family HTH domain